MGKSRYFEKQAGSWKVSDIAELAGTEEGVYLELKKPLEFVRKDSFSRGEFTRELVETVSAFLNSDGGVMRWYPKFRQVVKRGFCS